MAVEESVPLAPLTTLRIGPVAARLITCDTTEQGRRRAARSCPPTSQRTSGPGRRLQRRDRRRPDRSDRRAAGQHRDHRRRRRGARRGGRVVGRRGRHVAGARARRAGVPVGDSRLGGGDARCRTSARTASRWPTSSAASGCSTGAPARTAGWRRDDAGLRLPHQRAEELVATPSCSRSSSRSTPTGRSAPLRYGELATALGVEPGRAPTPTRVRDAVLALRAGKGMVLDDADHDTWSVGSFFTNPVVSHGRLRPARAPSVDGPVPNYPAPRRGQAGGGLAGRAGRLRQGLTRATAAPARLSTKHALALTNRGGATTADVIGAGQDGARRGSARIRDRSHTRTDSGWVRTLGTVVYT